MSLLAHLKVRKAAQRANSQHVEKVTVRALAAMPICHQEEEGPCFTAEEPPLLPRTRLHSPEDSSHETYRGQIVLYSQMFGGMLLRPVNNFHYLEIIILIRRESQKSFILTPGYRIFLIRRRNFFPQ